MAIAPRTQEELIRIMETDPTYRHKLYALVRKADKMLHKEQVRILMEFLKENGVDPRQMKGKVFDAVQTYYRKIKLNGDWVKMY